MNVYTCTDFSGHWPVGTAAVIVAENDEDANTILCDELARIGLPQNKELTFKLLALGAGPGCRILCDGDY